MRRINPQDITLGQLVMLLSHARKDGNTRLVCDIRNVLSTDKATAEDAIKRVCYAVEDLYAIYVDGEAS